MKRLDFTWYEFFAGGGMGRLGLGNRWQCVFANDCSDKKAAAYRSHFGPSPELRIDDVANLAVTELPGHVDLAWASFPCQDLSLAGSGEGLKGKRSGTFRPFWALMEGLILERRAPRIVVLENVIGALTSHDGKDFTAIINAVAQSGYRVGCLVIDAVHFVPQSRPRLFIIGVSETVSIPELLISPTPSDPWHPKPLRAARERLPGWLDPSWIWWRLPTPQRCRPSLVSVVQDEPVGVTWHTLEETKHLLSLMSPLHQRKVEAAKRARTMLIGTVYRRTRPGSEGNGIQRAEVRFDNISGCLRTPVGGSSRQTILFVEGNRVRSRLLSPREAARLMGVPDAYPVPKNYNDAYHLFGDGVVVPVVAWLEKHLLRHIALATSSDQVAEYVA